MKNDLVMWSVPVLLGLGVALVSSPSHLSNIILTILVTCGCSAGTSSEWLHDDSVKVIIKTLMHDWLRKALLMVKQRHQGFYWGLTTVLVSTSTSLPVASLFFGAFVLVSVHFFLRCSVKGSSSELSSETPKEKSSHSNTDLNHISL